LSQLDQDLALAHRLADEARTISLSMFRGTFEQRLKADGSIVTTADEAVERAIRERLGRERPADAMLGEEGGESGHGSRRWIVDAIDGTHSFASGSPQWGTLIALEIAGEVVIGVCDMAPLDRRYWAARGHGAFRRDATADAARLHVSTRQDFGGSRCFVAGDPWLPDQNTRTKAETLKSATSQPEPEDHPALLVAGGYLDAAVFFLGGPWDLAAPSIVVEEAGGQFTDLFGGHNNDRTGGIFSNGHVHAATIAVAGT
jgi:histidinol-phosphatase